MKNKEFDQLDALLRQKDFRDLSAEEKLFVEEQIGGERAYKDISILINTAKEAKSIAVSSSIKRNLTNKFKQRNKSATVSWFNFKLPVYANLPIAALLALFIWLVLPTKEIEVDKIVTVQLPPKVDTLLIQSPSDTIFIEKKVRIEVPVYITKIEETQSEKQPKISGSTLADQQGLADLLVSGK